MMTSLLLCLLALLPLVTLVDGHGTLHCGTQNPDMAFAALDAARVSLLKAKHGRRAQLQTCDELCTACIEVPVYFHLLLFDGEDFDFIPHPSAAVQQYLDGETVSEDDFSSVEDLNEIIDAQVQVLNEQYANTPFFFTLQDPGNPSLAVNTDWARYAFDERFDISAALAKGELTTLNVFLGYSVEGRNTTVEGRTLAGFSSFPSWQFENQSDGIYQRYDVLTDGGFPSNEVGMTTVHEAGHWLGKSRVVLSLEVPAQLPYTLSTSLGCFFRGHRTPSYFFESRS